jgi:hypothetical protein
VDINNLALLGKSPPPLQSVSKKKYHFFKIKKYLDLYLFCQFFFWGGGDFASYGPLYSHFLTLMLARILEKVGELDP